MNYAYLIVEGCNGYGKNYFGVEKLKYSIESLKKCTNKYNNIYVYYSYDDTNVDSIEKIVNFCNESNVIPINIGHLKHDFGKGCREMSNPYRLNILIEKIYILLNHDQNEEICFVDLDTEFNQNIDTYEYDLSVPLLWNKEYPLLGSRNLGEFFNNIMKYPIDQTSMMFNSGFIFIPKDNRILIARESIDLVIEMNKYPDNVRCCKDLDEQVALSVIIYKHYKDNIKFMDKILNHYWDKCMRNEKYWDVII